MKLRLLLLLPVLVAVVIPLRSQSVKKIDRGVEVRLPTGVLELTAVADNAIRVRFAPNLEPAKASLVLLPSSTTPAFGVDDAKASAVITLKAHGIEADIDRATGALSFRDPAGNILLRELPGRREAIPATVRGRPTLAVQAAFVSPPDERLFGTGQFQDGYLDVRNLPRRLTQVNTQIAIPMLISSKGYGLLWHNYGLTELNPADQRVELTRAAVADRSEDVDVTTTVGSKRESRRSADFIGSFTAPTAGKYAFLLDVGRKMGRQWNVEIDGQSAVSFRNQWLPPTTSWLAPLTAGEHHVVVRAEQGDAPTLYFRPEADETVLRSPTADALDYVVFAGSADDVIATYRRLTGPAPLLPRWAFGYVHCRERFKTQAEVLDTAKEFRRRGLPLDLIVQDWQYWGHYGWGAPQFDEAAYPDPAAMMRELHGEQVRLMLSVWSKVDHHCKLGTELAAKSLYIPQTDWVDFFNPAAAAMYWDALRTNLLSVGVDSWWMDATEPENDDLVGRNTFAGPGEFVRDVYPLVATRTVYEGQRRAAPDQRVLILTRSAFLGEQRYAAVTWSGDIGNDWETLRRQVTAGLGYSVTGMPWWTVDAGGFFRPGASQYTDPDYHERFLRWFQFVTFCPLQRVHGYQTDTEFWRFGEDVENVARQYLALRYRLLPYLYSEAARVNRAGSTLMRPLVMDFARDPQALAQRTEFMFGPSLLVSPVLAAKESATDVYLPVHAGGWYDFWTGAQQEAGVVKTATPIDRIPLHVPAGSIIPLGPERQNTADAATGPIEVRIYPGANATFTLYDDDGTTNAYERGAATTIQLRWNDAARELTIGARQGSFPEMAVARTFRIERVAAGRGIGIEASARPDAEVQYHGQSVSVTLK